MVLKAVFITFFYFSRLSLLSLSLLLKAKYKWRKAKATFQETLILQGIPKEAAQELAKAYPNPMNEFLTLMNFREHRH